jgi:hypothetical protein
MAKAPNRKTEIPGPLPGLRRWHVAALMALAVGLLFRDVLLQKAYFWEDFIYQYYAFRDFAAVSLARGHLPLWNPYTFNGMPFQADIQTAVFYIPNMFLTLLVQGDRLPFFWVEALIIAHFVLAGAAMTLLAEDFGLERPYALFSGLVYALSGFMITHAIHHTFISEVTWAPLVLFLFRRTLLRRSAVAMILAAMVLGLSVLGGAPQFTLYVFVFLFAYFLFEFAGAVRADGLGRAWTMIPLAAGVIGLAVALTAVQLLPTMELAGLSARSEITFQKSAESSLQWPQLVTLLVPKYFGASGAREATYWLTPTAWDYWETCLYVGIPGLLAAAAAVPMARKNRSVAFLVGVCAFAILYALGDNFVFHSFFFHYVPGFDKFRIPGRMSFLFTFAAALLGGFGLKRLLEAAVSAPRESRRFLLGAAGAGIAVWAAAQAGVFQPAANPALYQQIHPLVTPEATTALVLILAVCAVLFFAGRKALSLSAAVAAILLVQVVDMNVFGANQNSGDLSPDAFYGRTSDIVNVIKKDQEHEYFRVNGRKGGAILLDRNQGMVDRIFLMEGYTPLSLQRIYTPAPDWTATCDLLNAKYRIRVDEVQRTMGLDRAEGYLPRAFVVYDARVMADSLVSPFMVQPSFNPARTVALEERPALAVGDTSYDAGWTAAITSYSENVITLDVTMPKNGYVVLSEIYYPGWQASIDGAPERVYRADWNLRAVPVPAGRHALEVRFAPPPFIRGAWISGLTFAGCLGALVVFRLRRRAGQSAGSAA